MTDKKVLVNMLGEFSIKVDDNAITDRSNHSKKMWTVLEYLIAFRNKELSQSDIVNALWPDEDDSVNPTGALKTLMHRVRNLLQELDAPELNFIVQSRGAYAWNNAIPCTIDIEEFEKLYNEMTKTTDPDKKLAIIKDALSLYKGDFLPKSAHKAWAAPLVSCYRSMYEKLVSNAIELLLEKKQYDEITNICWSAITIVPSNEDFHYYLIYSLYHSDNQQAALSHYNNATYILYEEFGITPSEKLKALYKEILSTINSINTDLNLVIKELEETGLRKGAFFCEYGIFQDIYRLFIRTAARSSRQYFVCLITVTDALGVTPPQDIINKSMDTLKINLAHSLRSSDVFTRYSLTQYILLIPDISYETGEHILARIINEFNKTNDDELVLQYSLQDTRDIT